MKWYVVQAYSGYENKVKLSLEERIKQAGMEGRFGNILIPKENVQESRGGKRRLSSRTFYPGYIFVQMDLDDQTWHLIKDTPKVNGFVGGRLAPGFARDRLHLHGDEAHVALAVDEYLNFEHELFCREQLG